MPVWAPGGDNESTATVIARVLPPHRGQGFGGHLYDRGLAQARKWAPTRSRPSSNPAGLRFALGRGFVEVGRHLLPGGAVPWITLRLP